MEFPSPHEVKTIPGTEGWERMYPYHYRFVADEPQRKSYEEQAFWFYDGLHYPEPIYPFDTIWDEAWYLGLSQFNNRIFHVPPSRGVDHRILNGHVYISAVPVTDPKEIESRVPNFLERAGYYYENWETLEANWKMKLEATIKELEGLEIPSLPELEELSVVTEGVGQSKGYQLLKAYDDLINLGIKCWQYHFEFLNIAMAANVVFIDFVQKMFPAIPLQRITQMVAGIDVILFRSDEELKKLAKHALELGVEDILTCGEWSIVEPELKGGQAGRKWLALMEEARQPWFNISTGTGWSHKDRCWNDDLNIPLTGIVSYINKLKRGETVDRPMEEVRAERDRITAEYRELIQNSDDRETFDKLLATAKTVFPYMENHSFYVEHWFHTVFWTKVREVAAIMKEHGMIEEIDDIFLLRRDEIKQALWDLVTAWACGTVPRGEMVWPDEIAWRKGVMEKFYQWSAPPAIGTAPEVITDPFAIVLWGITNSSITDWSSVQENVSELKGFAGSTGVAEGIARVCLSASEIGTLKKGEILVARTTSPSWAPAFTKIGAVITDVGGVMSHAAITCREYGMPAVVGTGHGTKVIKTGMRLRVDGSTGYVTILSQPAEEDGPGSLVNVAA